MTAHACRIMSTTNFKNSRSGSGFCRPCDVGLLTVIMCVVFLVRGPRASAFSSSSLYIAPPVTGSRAAGRPTQLLMSVPTPLDTLTSGFASIFCLPFGVTVSPRALSSPSSLTSSSSNIRIVKLYDIENSPQCRRVRERITELDLVVETVVPAASNSRAAKIDSDLATGGKVVPLMVASTISNNEVIIVSGVDDILSFLDDSFPGAGSETDATTDGTFARAILNYLHQAGSYLAGWVRAGRGAKVASCVVSSPGTVNRPEKPLTLYSYEGNQFCRLVREVLTELDIAYELRSAGKESPRRAELASITGGSSQCPYLIDPNTGASMSESKDIIQYLYDKYALWTPPSELLEWTSDNVMSLAKPIFKTMAPLQAGSRSDPDSNIEYQQKLSEAKREVQDEIASDLVIVYTYDLSPFSFETKALLDRLKLEYTEISLGKEWIPGLVSPGGAIKRAALLEMTGQSSLPHIFIGGQPIGGLFSGQPGLLPLLREGKLWDTLKQAKTGRLNSVGVFE